MGRFLSRSVALALAATTLLAGASLPSPPLAVSFRDWTVVQYGRWEQGPARWILADGETTATQVLNADASILLSDFTLDHLELHGTWRVADAADDDLMGFAFGFIDNKHFFLFDWKQGAQFSPRRGLADQGMTVKRIHVDSPPTASDLWPTYGPDSNRVATLYHNNIPWRPFTDYRFTLESFPGRFIVTVHQSDDQLAEVQIEDPTFIGGRFGLYNSSQEQVQYRAFTRRTVPPLPFFHIDSVTVNEGNNPLGQALFTLRLSEPYHKPVSLTVSTADDTAIGGWDYVPLPPTRITFEPGETEKTIVVGIIGDSVREPEEQFRFTLSEPIRGRLSEPYVLGRILDDDAQDNLPPSVGISVPQDGAQVPTTSGLLISAVASDPDGQVEQVDFYQGATWLGQSGQEPFALFWTNLALGDHSLLAVATDNHGAQATSAPVRIRIVPGTVYAEVAIVRNHAAAEIGWLQRYLSEIALTSDLFEQEGLTSDTLRNYRLVIWNDLGSNGLTEATALVLRQIFDQQVPLYLIGERLVGGVLDFSQAARQEWFDLLRVAPSNLGGGHGVVEALEVHPATDGPFGAVLSFPYSDLIEPVRRAGAGELLLGSSADAELLLAYEDPQAGTRLLTQDFLVWSRADACGQPERARLFKNAVWWLIRNPPLPRFMNLFLGGSIEPEATEQGRPLALSVAVVHNGELPATDTILSYYLPPEVALLEAVPSQGSCASGCGVVTCQLGDLSQSVVVTVQFLVAPLAPGLLTNTLTLSSSAGEARTTDNLLQIIAHVAAPVEVGLRIVPPATEPARLELRGPPGAYVVDQSTNLIHWLSWTNLDLIDEVRWLDLPGNGPQHFFRARHVP